MPEAKMVMGAPSAGKNKGRAYQDRDKPAQIRYSNISAAKGRLISNSKCWFLRSNYSYIVSGHLKGVR